MIKIKAKGNKSSLLEIYSLLCTSEYIHYNNEFGWNAVKDLEDFSSFNKKSYIEYGKRLSCSCSQKDFLKIQKIFRKIPLKKLQYLLTKVSINNVVYMMKKDYNIEILLKMN